MPRDLCSYYLWPLWWKFEIFSPYFAFQDLVHHSPFEAVQLSGANIKTFI